MALELYRCESPDCEYVTENPQADRCPLCGGTFFVKAEEGEVTPKGWLGLCREADRDGRQRRGARRPGERGLPVPAGRRPQLRPRPVQPGLVL